MSIKKVCSVLSLAVLTLSLLAISMPSVFATPAAPTVLWKYTGTTNPWSDAGQSADYSTLTKPAIDATADAALAADPIGITNKAVFTISGDDYGYSNMAQLFYNEVGGDNAAITLTQDQIASGYLSFYINASAPKYLSFYLDNNYNADGSGVIRVKEDQVNTWTRVEIPLSSMSTAPVDNAVIKVCFRSPGWSGDFNGTTTLGDAAPADFSDTSGNYYFGSGDTFSIAGIEITSSKPVDPSVVVFNITSKTGPWGDGDPAFASVRAVQNDPRFKYYDQFFPTSSWNADGQLMNLYNNLQDHSAYQPTDISSAVANGYLRFWVKTASAGKKFNVVLKSDTKVDTTSTVNLGTPVTVTVDQANKWEEFQVKVSDLVNASLDTHNVSILGVTGAGLTSDQTFAVGENFKIAGMKIYTGVPEDFSADANLDTDIAPAADDGSFSTDASSLLFTTDFTAAAYSDTPDDMGPVTVADVTDGPNFTQAYKWSIGPKFNTPWRGYNFYGLDVGDVTAGMQNGYLSFYVKSSRANVQLFARVSDNAGTAGNCPLAFTIKNANEWQEVRISLYDLIANSSFDPTCFQYIMIMDPFPPYSWSGGAPGCTGDGYLASGDTLMISPMQITSGKPLDPSVKITTAATTTTTKAGATTTTTKKGGNNTSTTGNSSSPQTSDNGNRVNYILLFLLSGAAAVALLPKKKAVTK